MNLSCSSLYNKHTKLRRQLWVEQLTLWSSLLNLTMSGGAGDGMVAILAKGGKFEALQSKLPRGGGR
jgi:hypothetical protein